MNLREAIVLVEGAVADSVAYYGKTSCCAKDNSHVLKVKVDDALGKRIVVLVALLGLIDKQ